MRKILRLSILAAILTLNCGTFDMAGGKTPGQKAVVMDKPG